MRRLVALFVTVALLLVFVSILSTCAPVSETASPTPIKTESTAPPAKVAWKEKWDSTVAAARKEGQVVIYGEVLSELRMGINKGIKNLLGYEPEYVSGKSPEIAARYLKERDAGLALADILLTGQTTSLTLIKPKGVIASQEPFLILPDVLDIKNWPQGRLPFLDRDRTVMPLIAAYRSFIAVNTKMVKEGQITSYQDLLNPLWKGKIVIYDPTMPGAGSSWFTLMLTKLLGMEEGKKFMMQLAQQEPVFTRDSRLQVEWLAKEKYPVAVAVLPQVLVDFVNAGAPIEYAKAKEGGIILYGAGCLVLPDTRPHPNASTVVLNWLLTEEGQTAFSQGFGEPAMRLGVTTAGINPGTVAPPGAKVTWVDEDFILTEPKLWAVSKEIFGPLIR